MLYFWREVPIGMVRKGKKCVKNRLKQIRRERGIEQVKLAEAIGVSRQTISSLEKGRYNPSIELAFRLARYFGIAIEDIFIYEKGEDDG